MHTGNYIEQQAAGLRRFFKALRGRRTRRPAQA
jgi:hypothetical protein